MATGEFFFLCTLNNTAQAHSNHVKVAFHMLLHCDLAFSRVQARRKAMSSSVLAEAMACKEYFDHDVCKVCRAFTLVRA